VVAWLSSKSASVKKKQSSFLKKPHRSPCRVAVAVFLFPKVQLSIDYVLERSSQ